MAIYSLLVPASDVPSVYQAAAGLVVFLIFGSQSDVLQSLRILKGRSSDFVSTSGERSGGHGPSRSKSYGASRGGGGISIGVVTTVETSPSDTTAREGAAKAWEHENRDAWGADEGRSENISMVSLDGKSLDGGESGLGTGMGGEFMGEEEYGSKAELTVGLPTLDRR